MLAPERVSVPAPDLVRLKPDPLITPPTVKFPPLAVTVREAFSVTAPVPRFRSLVPVNVKLLFQFWALLVLRVSALPLVLSIVPPEIVKVPVPSAEALLMFKVPALSVVPPE